MENENGFSLLELTITIAIMITLAGLSIGPLTEAKNKIESQIEEAKWLAENNPNSLITFE